MANKLVVWPKEPIFFFFLRHLLGSNDEEVKAPPYAHSLALHMADNKGKVVWECIGRSCALCKKDHKACNGQRPCSRCVGMGWESECRDVALKPRGRPRKMRPTKTTKTSLGSQDCEEGLSVSPSLFVSSFPFLPTAGREQGRSYTKKKQTTKQANERQRKHRGLFLSSFSLCFSFATHDCSQFC